MRAVITVIGRDMVGILAKVATLCSNYHMNVTDVTQSVLQELFAMIMMVDMSGAENSFMRFKEDMQCLGEEMGLSIHVTHEDVYNAMHKI